nr:hypothetical protein [Enterobacter sp.]
MIKSEIMSGAYSAGRETMSDLREHTKFVRHFLKASRELEFLNVVDAWKK